MIGSYSTDSLSPPIRIAGESSLDAVPDVQTTQPPFRTPPPEIHQRRTSLVSPPPIRGIYLIETPPPTENIPDSELLLGHLARDDDPDLSRADVVRYNELLPEDPVPSLYTKEEEVFFQIVFCTTAILVLTTELRRNYQGKCIMGKVLNISASKSILQLRFEL